jgi:polyferredoxin
MSLQQINFHIFRRLIQASFTFFCVYIGIRFYQFHQWITGHSSYQVARPPSVEAFLPISALMSLKKLILTGNYDTVHPAGLTILIAAIIVSFLARKGFCGWICPIGFVSNLAEDVARKLKTVRETPFFVNLPLLTLKYFLLVFFSYLILWKMDIKSIDGFIRSPYNIVADAKMLDFFLAPSNITIAVMAFLTIISLFIRNFWCRFLCPYGALIGITALLSPSYISRNSETCIDCKKCEKKCPTAIKLTKKSTIKSQECIGCLECVEICPIEDCLSVRFVSKKLPTVSLPAFVVIVFLGLWLWASTTGHWHQQLQPQVLKRYYNMSFKISH